MAGRPRLAPGGRTARPVQHDYGSRPLSGSSKILLAAGIAHATRSHNPGPPMASTRVLILRAPGANCDRETQYAFELAGAQPERLHINRLRENPALLQRFQVLVVPGGFTYGDDVAAGKILGNQLAHFLGDELRRFRDRERLILGICNGFQVLLKAGLLISPDEEGPIATLTHNTCGRFEDRWIYLQATPGKC